MEGRGPPHAPPPCREEDDAALARALGDVEPLAKRDRVPAREGAQPRVEPAAAAAPTTAAPALEVDPERLCGRVSDLDPRVLRRLRRGEPKADAELDLHGHSRGTAEREVARFVTSSAASGRRVVRIVHGRGLHSESGPVLREELARWLASPPCAACVLAFVPAPASEGGAGAVRVLLRARRT